MFQIPVPVIAGKHSDRLFAAQTVSPLGDIQSLLGHDPRSPWKSAPPEVREVYETVQRKTDKERKVKLQSYLIDRMSRKGAWIGGLPAIAIGVQNPQKFQSTDPARPESGTLFLDTSPENLRILFDGLGRVSTAMDALADQSVSPETKKVLRELYVPVTIYLPNPGGEPLSIGELGQMFHDFNVLGQNVGKGMAIDLDKSDIYVQMSERMSSASVFMNYGGVDNRGSATPRKGTLVTKMSLVKMIRAAVEGPGSHVDHYTDSVLKPQLTWDNFSEHQIRMIDYLTVISEQMGEHWGHHSFLHLTTPSWIAMGLVYHDIFHGNLAKPLDETTKQLFVKRIGQIDWSTKNRDFLTFLGNPAIDKTTGAPAVDDQGYPSLRMFGGGKAFYNLAGYIRHKIGLTHLLNEPQFGNPENFDVLLKAA